MHGIRKEEERLVGSSKIDLKEILKEKMMGFDGMNIKNSEDV